MSRRAQNRPYVHAWVLVAHLSNADIRLRPFDLGLFPSRSFPLPQCQLEEVGHVLLDLINQVIRRRRPKHCTLDCTLDFHRSLSYSSGELRTVRVGSDHYLNY